MYYIIYKTTNIVNNKFYIGKHRQTDNPYEFDGYYGSGVLLLNAIKKHGKLIFFIKSLYVFVNETECLLKEEELVSPHYGKPHCYNIRSGGVGGFEHINSQPKETRINIIEYKRKTQSGEIRTGGTAHWTPDSYKKLQDAGRLTKGDCNGNYGTKYYTNLQTNESRRFKPTDTIPDGWVQSVEYRESQKTVRWYNDGSRNYFLKIDDPKIKNLELASGRVPKKPA